MRLVEKQGIRNRLKVVGGLFLMALLIIVLRAFHLQVLQNERLGSIAQSHYTGRIPLPPKRGTICDRRGKPLAMSIASNSVFVHPHQVPVDRRDLTADLLASYLGEARESILEKLQSSSAFVWIVRKVPTERSEPIRERVKTLKLQGVGLIGETSRFYPAKELACHVLGFSGMDNNGLEGIEKQYDTVLRGPERSLDLMRDASGRPFWIEANEAADQGTHDLVLTIDAEIQYKAQQALQSAVQKTHAKAGQCLVVDPNTGEILALAVFPDFNPNTHGKYPPDVWRNRIVADTYEPGSALKPFLLAACLEEKSVTPLTSFNCENGQYTIGRSTIHDVHPHGVMSVADIIRVSSNIGAIKMGFKLGYPAFCRYLRAFGFGLPTGLDLRGERSGFIRSEKEARPIEQATLFFGQGLTGSTIQMSMAMAAIANGGRLMKPYIVKEIRDASGKTVKENSPQVVRTVISGETARMTAAILQGVVSMEGTAQRAALPGFFAAGKTGTSQKVDPETGTYSKKKYVGTFVGFVPAHRPRLVIQVVIDEPVGAIYGGVVAAPVFKEVGEWALNYLGVSPEIATRVAVSPQTREKPLQVGEDRERSIPSEEVSRIALDLKEWLVPDFKGLGVRDVFKKARDLGIAIRVEGTGLAVSQEPLAGSTLEGVKTIRVVFSPPS